MLLNPALSSALDRIAERAADVRRAFTAGAVPDHGDVAAAVERSDFTLDPLSAAPPDGAYFIVRDARGRTAYTRDGAFSVAGGRLLDARGAPVLGRRTPDAPLDELHVDAVDAALERTANLRVGADGSLLYNRDAVDPRTGKRVSIPVVAGRIALARFPAATRLETADGRTFYAPDGVSPHAGLAGDGAFEALSPMHRTGSRVDLDVSLLRLKDAYTAFDALAAAESAKGRFDKAAMDVVK